MSFDRRRRDWDGRQQIIIAPDDDGSEPRLCLGPKRYRLRLHGSERWIAADINRMTEDGGKVFTETAAEALHFSTPGEAFAFWRHVSPLWPIDEDGRLHRPLADLDLVIEEAV